MRPRCRAPPCTPTLSSGSPNDASSAATTKSHDAASARPVPNAAPATAPTTGTAHSWMAKNASRTWNMRSRTLSRSIVAKSSRSLPAQKCLPSPVSTTARTPSPIVSISANRSRSSRYITRSTALTGGRHMVTVATPSGASSVCSRVQGDGIRSSGARRMRKCPRPVGVGQLVRTRAARPWPPA